MPPPKGKPAGPFDCHPAYTDRAATIRRIIRDKPYVLLPFTVPLFGSFDDPDPTGPSFKTQMLTRYKAAGPAPWTGAPYMYWWYVAADDLGRQVGDGQPARIRPTDDPTDARDLDEYACLHDLWRSAVLARRRGIYAGHSQSSETAT